MLTSLSVLTLILAVFYAALVFFFLKGWLSLPVYCLQTPPYQPVTKVSVLIAARNEELLIAATIEDVLAQQYPKHLVELIIIDDHSTDRTAEIVLSYANLGVRLLQLKEDSALNSYKKKAITEAIKISTGELIITTDADCRMGERWLSTIVSFYEKNNFKLVSSPVLYHEERSFFERLQTLEFLYLIGLGAASIGNKVPSTCNGANLAYKRDVFFELKGFQGIDDLASGDDELFLHKVASAYPGSIGFCKSSDATVFTYAKPTLKEFIRQRKRWASKSTKYKDKKIVALGVSIWLFNVLILITSLAGIFFPICLTAAVTSLAIKFTVEIAFLIALTKFAKRRELIMYLPLLTIIHVVYIIYIGLAGNSGKYIWKERLVN